MRRNAGKRIWNAVTTALVVLVVLLAVALVGVRLVGLEPYVILSGSMEPVYPVGSLVYVKNTPAADIKTGDPIAFVMNAELVVAIHRVIGVDPARQCFYTKGDANEAPDASPVHFNNLIGRPVLCVPYLGYVSGYLTNPPGMYIGGAAALALLLLMFVPDMIRRADAADRADAAKAGPRTACGRAPGATEKAARRRKEAAQPRGEASRNRARQAAPATAQSRQSDRPRAQMQPRRMEPAGGISAAEARSASAYAARTQRPQRRAGASGVEQRRRATERAMEEAERALREARALDDSGRNP